MKAHDQEATGQTGAGILYNMAPNHKLTDHAMSGAQCGFLLSTLPPSFHSFQEHVLV